MAKKSKKVSKKNYDKEETNKKVTKKVLVKTKAKTAPSATVKTQGRTMAFGKENYKWVGIGLALILIGMLLMMGGFNENPADWDEGKIYSFRRITIAPIVILTGLVVQIYAIFR